MSATAPNEKLAALLEILGDADTRELARLYLSNVPRLLADIGSSDREQSRRAAHSLKSSSDAMGASALRQLAAALEARLNAGGGLPSPAELAEFAAELANAEQDLRGFAGS